MSLVIIIYNRLPPRFQYVLSALTVLYFFGFQLWEFGLQLTSMPQLTLFSLDTSLLWNICFLNKTSHTLACSKGFLPRQGIVTSSAKLVWFVEMLWKDNKKFLLPHPLPSPSFWLLPTPLVNISFFPEPSTAEKVRDGSFNFH